MSDDAVILVNLGSPVSFSPDDVGRFLRQFLSDRRVVDAPAWYWKPVLNGIIIPFRKKRSAKAYQRVWWQEGSPIRVISARQKEALEKRLQALFNNRAPAVYVAETYGKPSIESCLEKASETHQGRILVFPLYPQYSATTSGAVFDQVAEFIKKSKHVPSIGFVSDYYQSEKYIDALAESVNKHWQEQGKSEKLLVSFHGIPVEYVNVGDPYQKHCEKTAEKLVEKLALNNSAWQISYQSRFGPKEWLQPYTDDILSQWANEGVSSVTVISPAFSADCLETLEELAIESKDVFLSNGGQKFSLVACLNDVPAHIDMMVEIIEFNLNLQN